MLKNKKDIESWLKEMEITQFSINHDLTVDVKGGVNLIDKKLKIFPVHFGHVEGNFYCCDNELTSLLGAPKTLTCSFNCDDNKLTSLKFCPQKIEGEFSCSNNKLTSFVGGPITVDLGLDCSHNKLKTIEFCPKKNWRIF